MASMDEGARLSTRARRYEKLASEAGRAYADWLYAHRNDPHLWGDPEPDPRTPEQRAAQRAKFAVSVTVRFDPAMTRAMNERQRATDETSSELIRAAVATYLSPSQSLNFVMPNAIRTVNRAQIVR